MPSIRVRAATEADRAAWDGFALGPGGGSLLSTWGWGELKRRQGWGVERLVAEGEPGVPAGTLWLQHRRGPLGVSFAYAPRGPLVADPGADADAEAALALIAAARSRARGLRALLLKLDPEWPEGSAAAARLLTTAGLRPSWYDVQHRKTYLVSLEGGAEAAFARFKESTRRAIRLCERSGCTVEVSTEPEAAPRFHPLLWESGRRNGFIPREADYYRDIVEEVGRSCPVAVVLVTHEGQLAAGMIAVACGPRLVYLYGGNHVARGRVHPAYAAQWAAIRWGAEQGCRVYDMWGVPNHEDAGRPGFGYYEFKTRFNGHVVRHLRCQEARIWPLGPLPGLVERLALRGRPLLTD